MPIPSRQSQDDPLGELKRRIVCAGPTTATAVPPVLPLPASMQIDHAAHRLADQVIGGSPDLEWLADLSLRMKAWAEEVGMLEAEARAARR